MAATGRSSLSSPQRLHNHHHHHTHHQHHHQQQRSASACNLNLRLKFSPGNNPKVPTASQVSNQKRKCLCSPTTHPGSFRCAFHRRLEIEKIGTLNSPEKRNNGGGGGGGNTKRNVGLNMRKQALVNSLKRIGTVEAERLRRSLAARLVKPSYINIRRRPEFRPKLSRFCELRKDED
ncbi:unnamed protein product [Cochlearia groenlandica]